MIKLDAKFAQLSSGRLVFTIAKTSRFKTKQKNLHNYKFIMDGYEKQTENISKSDLREHQLRF